MDCHDWNLIAGPTAFWPAKWSDEIGDAIFLVPVSGVWRAKRRHKFLVTRNMGGELGSCAIHLITATYNCLQLLRHIRSSICLDCKTVNQAEPLQPAKSYSLWLVGVALILGLILVHPGSRRLFFFYKLTQDSGLWMYHAQIQKVSIMISGGTGSAKFWLDRAAKIQRPVLDIIIFAHVAAALGQHSSECDSLRKVTHLRVRVCRRSSRVQQAEPRKSPSVWQQSLWSPQLSVSSTGV